MMTKITPPLWAENQGNVAVKKPRSSNLELYRIVCMLMIVSYHYVVNSGLIEPIQATPTEANSLYLLLFGAWGKVGINCFLMITGYYMCTSKITLRKFVKMLAQIYFFKIVIFIPFIFTGYEQITAIRLMKLFSPITGLSPNYFVGCFLVFWLTIPFLNILVQNMNKREHLLLVLLLLSIFTVCGTIPHFDGPSINYITWFGVIYFIASYIRLYDNPIFAKKSLWGWLTLLSFVLAMISIDSLGYKFGTIGGAHYFVVDSNKILAVAIAVCSFLWFKNMKIGYSKWINAIGGSTFGVLLIHANSNAMRTWLWKDTVDCVGHYTLPLGSLMLYSIGVVLVIFIVCSILDQLRGKYLEVPFLRWYDKHNYDERFGAWIKNLAA